MRQTLHNQSNQFHLHARISGERRISTCPIHLYGSEALLSASLRSLIHIARLIPADPPIDFDTIAHFATKQLPDRHAELLAFDVPECNIQTRQCRLL